MENGQTNGVQGEGLNLVVEQVTFPKFHEFCKLQESVDTEMTLYSEIASKVDQLKQIYGDKAIGKTGMMKALLSVNELILTGKKENQPQSSSDATAQPAQTTQFTQPQAQTTQPQFVQPQATQPQATQPQATQPQAQTAQPEKK